MDIGRLITQHSPNVALQFSGGRDSLAMLLHLRAYWRLLTVYYCDSGDAFPETQALVAAVARVVPSFVRVNGEVRQVHNDHGWPSDVLPPGANSAFGHQFYTEQVRLQDRNLCCFRTLMQPMHTRIKHDGITLVLRGQRDDDYPRSTVLDRDVIDGVTVAYPLKDWSVADVEAVIREHGVPVPRYYAEGMTSAPDCMCCTAWLEHGAHRYLSKFHRAEAAEVNRRLAAIRVTVEPYVRNLISTRE